MSRIPTHVAGRLKPLGQAFVRGPLERTLPDTEDLSDLALAFVALNEVVAGSADPAAAPQRLVELAVRSVPGCDFAAITVWPVRRPPHSRAATDDTALAVDQIQYDLGDGPCLYAATTGESVHLPDLQASTRWPQFSATAVSATPVRGVQAFHLLGEPTPSALNLYSREAGAFDDESVTVAAIFAAHARVLMLHSGSDTQVRQLSEALGTSRQIGAAVGILMSLHKIDAEQAFDLLRVASHNLNLRLSLVAEQVTRTGTLPEIPRRR